MSSEVWGRFELDPRSSQAARLRASDRDRDVALEILGQAFAEGRLDHEEHDARSTAVTSAKVLGDLAPHLVDLVPDGPGTAVAGRPTPGSLTRSEVHQQAVRHWEKSRREAATGFVTVSLVCWTIWAVVMPGGFVWPIFPSIAALVNLLRTQLQKRDIIDEHEQKLLRREEKALKRRADGID